MSAITIERADVLNEPEGFEHSMDDLLEAVRAQMFWHLAEDQHIGTFQDKMNLASYAEWCCSRALGLSHDKEWQGVPQIILSFGGTA